MASVNSTSVPSCSIVHDTDSMESLGRALFSPPSTDRNNAIVSSKGSMPSEGIAAGDLLRIDFTATTIDRDGLYVVTMDDEWIGYKRFQCTPGGLFNITDGVPVSPDLLEGARVIGLVKEIFHSKWH